MATKKSAVATPAAIERRRHAIIGRLLDNHDEWAAKFYAESTEAENAFAENRIHFNRHDRKSETLAQEFGRRLTAIRQLRGMTQDEVGNKLRDLGIISPAGRTNTYVARIERGEYESRMEIVAGLCDALKCSPNDLIPPFVSE